MFRCLSIVVLISALLVGLSSYYIKSRVGANGLGYSTEAIDAVVNESLVKGKNILISGTSTGIGKETARVLAKVGANVFVACRRLKTCEEGVNEIIKETRNKNVKAMTLDLASLKSIEEFARDFEKLNIPLHTLILNAGVVMPSSKTEDGFELMLGVNHIGHFHLTKLLIGSLKRAAPNARVIVVSSGAHEFRPKIDFNDISGEGTWGEGLLGTFKTYGQSKTCNVLFAHQLNILMQNNHIGHAYSLNPGAIRTELGAEADKRSLVEAFWAVAQFYAKSLSQGSATTCYLASAPFDLLIGGAYYDSCNHYGHGSDLRQAAPLWKWTEEQIAKATNRPEKN